MGDVRRFMVFADFIEKQFPRSKSILDVAGGNGELSLWLGRMGKTVTLLDKRASLVSRRMPAGVTVLMADANTLKLGDHLHEYDLVVGLHPDEATHAVIDIAVRCGVPFAVVPCCVMPPGWFLEGIKRQGFDWMSWLAHRAQMMEYGTYLTRLDMRGANRVLKGWPLHKAAIKSEEGDHA